MTVEVVRAGALTTVQDLGRHGWAHLGVPRSGAADAAALRLANRLVGNAQGAAGLETTLTGCTLRLPGGAHVAVTGAPAEVRVDGRAAAHGAAFSVPAGGLVDVGSATAGVRSYVAVAGGVAVVPVLGSRATDTLSGLGPPPLREGTVLPIGDVPREAARYQEEREQAGGPAPPTVRAAPGGPVRVRLGPRDDWFAPEAVARLVSEWWTVSPASNRVAARLDGPALARAVAGELPSEGLVLGAVQVPSDGRPLIFLADHPTTGGYPVIGVVEPADLPVLAQARPGARLRFAIVG